MKNNIKIFALSLVGLLGLTACGAEVYALPTDYNDKLVDVNIEVYNNVANVVYDAIHENGIGNDVLDETLYIYAKAAFGDYETLKNVVEGTGDINAFVKEHKAYWDDQDAESHGDEASETEKYRVEAKLKAIKDKIATTMYDKINGGSYTDRHIFDEAKFLRSLRSDLESVADPDAPGAVSFRGQILPELQPEDVFDLDGYGVLNEDNYTGQFTYIADKVIPAVYRGLLSELYLTQESYNTIGRSYARKVNIIKFNNNSNYPNAAYYLAKNLVEKINTPNASLDIEELFNTYARAEIGIAKSEEELTTIRAILKEVHDTNPTDFTDVTKDPFNPEEDLPSEIKEYWTGTEYGDLAYKYMSMLDTTSGLKTDLVNNFTNSNEYPVYVGLKQKQYELAEKDYVTNGWFIKNGGLTSELPESIRSRLFNIAVANGVKETVEEQVEYSRHYNETAKEWEIPTKDGKEIENAYVCRINGHNFLKTSSRINGEKIDGDILHYDSDSKAYYIVEVVEAASSSKMNRSEDATNSYKKTRGAKTMEEFINEIGLIVASGDNYSTLATKKYLKEIGIQYHDQSVYDYFKNNYPELFE